jgi:2-methylisocitrate lyase-like PEP mutase family enzyme
MSLRAPVQPPPRSERIAAAAAAARALPFPFTLTGRTENFLRGRLDLEDTIRLAAEAGLVGCSIEDASGNPDAPIFEIGHACPGPTEGS